MSAALDLVKSLAAAGVEFATDGERIRWRNGDDRMTPEIVATLAAEKAAVIDFLTGNDRPDKTDKTDKTSPAGPLGGVLSVLSVLSEGGSPKNDPRREPRDLGRDRMLDAQPQPDDADTYADALLLHGPMSYGMAMRRLEWGGTRAGQAEAALRAAGRIAFNDNGRAYLTEGKGK